MAQMNVRAYLQDVCETVSRNHMFEADTQATRNALREELRHILSGETSPQIDTIAINSLHTDNKRSWLIELTYVTHDNLRQHFTLQWPL